MLKSPIVPIAAGAGGAVLAVVGADKLHLTPKQAAWITAGTGGALAYFFRGRTLGRIGVGVGAAGAALGALQLLSAAKAQAATAQAGKEALKKRQADGDVVTRQDLLDALTKIAEQERQARCDLTSALREEIKRVLDEREKAARPPLTRGADGYDFAEDEDAERNAYSDGYGGEAYGYGEDERNVGHVPPVPPQRRIIIGVPPVASTPPGVPTQSWNAPQAPPVIAMPPAPPYGGPPPYGPPYGAPPYAPPYGGSPYWPPYADPYGAAGYDYSYPGWPYDPGYGYMDPYWYGYGYPTPPYAFARNADEDEVSEAEERNRAGDESTGDEAGEAAEDAAA